MIYIYYTKEGKFQTNSLDVILRSKLHSPNEEIPTFYNTISNHKSWYFEGEKHRLVGPAVIWSDNDKWFYLKGKHYEFEGWLKNHPNQDETFQALMKLKYS